MAASCLVLGLSDALFFQEEELRKGGDPKYAHLNMDLHVFIEVFGPPCEAYALMAHAMEEVKKFLVPVCILMLFPYLRGSKWYTTRAVAQQTWSRYFFPVLAMDAGWRACPAPYGCVSR